MKNNIVIIALLSLSLCWSCSKQPNYVDIIIESDIVTSKEAIVFKNSNTTIDELINIPFITEDEREHYLLEIGIENIEFAEIRDKATNVKFFLSFAHNEYNTSDESLYTIRESYNQPYTPYNKLYYLCHISGSPYKETYYYITYEVGEDKYQQKIIQKKP
jgi:hypothetical protein